LRMEATRKPGYVILGAAGGLATTGDSTLGVTTTPSSIDSGMGLEEAVSFSPSWSADVVSSVAACISELFIALLRGLIDWRCPAIDSLYLYWHEKISKQDVGRAVAEIYRTEPEPSRNRKRRLAHGWLKDPNQ
jgi:hypothetical protein